MKLRERCDRLPEMLALAVYAAVVLRCAWVCDDAYITFRTIDNFISGHGLTWNPAERVQTFTHPLWLFLLSGAYALTREIHLTAIVVSFAVSMAAVLLYVARLAATPLVAVVGVAVFAFSKAFVDYSTSGLENPLTHLLLIGFAIVFLRQPFTKRDLLWLAVLAGLVVLNRMDALLLVLPGLMVRWWAHRSCRATGLLALGFVPFLAWELFALVYYGFPFPNTAYAKLGTGLAAGALIQQGLYYLLHSLSTDPLTLVVIAAGLAVPLAIGPRRLWPLGLGVAFYLMYVVRIGGDFMTGRFLTGPLVFAVVLLSQSYAAHSRRALLISLGAVVVVGLAGPRPPVTSGETYGFDMDLLNKYGIADERAFYYHATGLLRAARGAHVPDHEWARDGRAARQAGERVVVTQALGFLGFCAGPDVHVIDVHGLADPLLARLPPRDTQNWRIGHWWRPIPAGYVELLRSGQGSIADPEIARLYERLALITRGALFDQRRLIEIVRMNLGG